MDIRAAIDASIVFTEDELYNIKYAELKKLVKSSEDIPEVCVKYSYPLERFMYYENMQHYIPYYTEEEAFEKTSDNIVVIRHARYMPSCMHSHSFVEIPYVYRGACINILGENRIEMNEGDFCIMAPNVKHAIEIDSDSVLMNIIVRKSNFKKLFYSILCSDNIISNYFNDTVEHNNPGIIFCPAGDNIQIRSFLDTLIYQAIYPNELSSSVKDCLLHIILAYIIKNHSLDIKVYRSDNTSTKENDINIVNILGYIKLNPKNASLKSISKLFNYSPSYMSRKIKETTGLTLTEIISKYRLNNACLLLRNTMLPIDDIVNLTGYPTRELFYRHFKKEMKCTPAQYRKKSLST